MWKPLLELFTLYVPLDCVKPLFLIMAVHYLVAQNPSDEQFYFSIPHHSPGNIILHCLLNIQPFSYSLYQHSQIHHVCPNN